MLDLTNQRMQMVRAQIAARGVRNPAVLEAMRRVPREAFLPSELTEFAYQDTPLPIDWRPDNFATVYRCPHDRER